MKKVSNATTLVEEGSLRVGPWLIGLILGAVATKGIEVMMGDGLSFRDTCWLALSILLAAAIGYIFVLCADVKRYAHKVDQSRFHRLSIHRDLPDIEGSNAFSYCEKVVIEAKKSIVVVGPHFTNHVDVGTKSHSEYLEKGLEQCIKRHLAAKDGKTFYYHRIVQLDSDQFTALRNDPHHHGVVSPSLFVNEELASHVRDCLKRNESSLNFKCRVYGRQFIPSFPSVLVVDDRYVFFSLPSEVSQSNSSGGSSLDYSLVLAIEDITEEIPTLFRQMAEHFEVGAVEIRKVGDAN